MYFVNMMSPSPPPHPAWQEDAYNPDVLALLTNAPF